MGHIRSLEADSDLLQIWYFIAVNSGSSDVADRFIESITDRFLLLAQYPNIGRTRDEDLRPGLRSFSVGEHIIFYRARSDGEVVILRVLHGRRDIATLFDQ
jgi:toxin ParE1/3/4